MRSLNMQGAPCSGNSRQVPAAIPPFAHRVLFPQPRRLRGKSTIPCAMPQTRPPYIPGRIDDPNYLRIFDTTLRDGEQSPGATLTSKEKLDIARQLSKLGVDIIEAGFPVASPDDFDAVRNIARIVGNEVHADGYVPVICGLSRTKLADLERAWEAVKEAKLPRVHTFIATSEIHMKHKLRMTKEQVIQNAVTAVQHLRSLGCNDIEFSPEDAGRSDLEFLYQILGEVIKVGRKRAVLAYMHVSALAWVGIGVGLGGCAGVCARVHARVRAYA
ncbi:hypothetical protein DUNSADRAFT_5689 [Dunaliella salina]|uniref:2-isopropylmalate synthase n=1 Tax=Dunaliella salina TaxID=3046 RepID=A0ABQ7GPT1_DUNSA|nr:hypothetical protein DUNSADRAFT_5689 [Dunaliella salina]|eukprot:KAF5836614.1 hypothetical protein DUNSADRAFT_5689 [Dunaliella salina]